MFSTSPGWQGLPVKPASERGKDKDRPHWWRTSRVNSGWKQGLAGWPWAQQFTNLLLQFLPLQDKVRINGGLCHLWPVILLETAPSWNRVSPVRSVTYTSYKKEWTDKAKKKERKKKEGKRIYSLHNYQHYFSSFAIRNSFPLLRDGILNVTHINKLMQRQDKNVVIMILVSTRCP